MTVTGKVAGSGFGVAPPTSTCSSFRSDYGCDHVLNDRALGIQQVLRFRDARRTTVADAASIGLGRQPEAPRRVSQQSGLNLLMGTGYYREPYLHRSTVDQLAEQTVHDLEVGAVGTNLRAGIIGEIAWDRCTSSAKQRAFRAASHAHRKTGTTITTRAARWPVRGALVTKCRPRLGSADFSTELIDRFLVDSPREPLRPYTDARIHWAARQTAPFSIPRGARGCS